MIFWLFQVECASLQQELQEMEARNRRVQKKPSEEANQVLQVKIRNIFFFQDLKLVVHHAFYVECLLFTQGVKIRVLVILKITPARMHVYCFGKKKK
jgi:hypothetical protein